MAYQHTNSKGITYFLKKMDVTLIGGNKQTVYFFVKDQNHPKGEFCDLPEDKMVVENSRNGFLTLRNKQ